MKPTMITVIMHILDMFFALQYISFGPKKCQ